MKEIRTARSVRSASRTAGLARTARLARLALIIPIIASMILVAPFVRTSNQVHAAGDVPDMLTVAAPGGSLEDTSAKTFFSTNLASDYTGNGWKWNASTGQLEVSGNIGSIYARGNLTIKVAERKYNVPNSMISGNNVAPAIQVADGNLNLILNYATLSTENSNGGILVDGDMRINTMKDNDFSREGILYIPKYDDYANGKKVKGNAIEVGGKLNTYNTSMTLCPEKWAITAGTGVSLKDSRTNIRAAEGGIKTTGTGDIYFTNVGTPGDHKIQAEMDSAVSTVNGNIVIQRDAEAYFTSKKSPTFTLGGSSSVLKLLDRGTDRFFRAGPGSRVVLNVDTNESPVSRDGGTEPANYETYGGPEQETFVLICRKNKSFRINGHTYGTQQLDQIKSGIDMTEKEGWRWDAVNEELILDGYNGEEIAAWNDIKIRMADGSDNYITLKKSYSTAITVSNGYLWLTGGGNLTVDLEAASYSDLQRAAIRTYCDDLKDYGVTGVGFIRLDMSGDLKVRSNVNCISAAYDTDVNFTGTGAVDLEDTHAPLVNSSGKVQTNDYKHGPIHLMHPGGKVKIIGEHALIHLKNDRAGQGALVGTGIHNERLASMIDRMEGSALATFKKEGTPDDSEMTLKRAYSAAGFRNRIVRRIATIDEANSYLGNMVYDLGRDDLANSTDHRIMKARITGTGNSSISLTWSPVEGADHYVVYSGKCGLQYPYSNVGETTATSLKLSSIGLDKLSKGKFYKIIVLAADKDNYTAASSRTIHAATAGGKYTNVKYVKLSYTKGITSSGKVSSKKKLTGSTATKALTRIKTGTKVYIKCKTTKYSSKKNLSTHRSINYESSNSRVASVDGSSGRVTAISPGTCYIYAYAQDGRYKSFKVVVK